MSAGPLILYYYVIKIKVTMGLHYFVLKDYFLFYLQFQFPVMDLYHGR